MSAEGQEKPRRQFRLPAEDEAFLDRLGLRWEAINENGQRWVIVYGESIPAGFNVGRADVAIMMAPGYPPGALDMAHFSPPLMRTAGGEPRNCQGRVNIDGRAWQSWSRHWTSANPWVPGEDNFESHYLYMRGWLEAELRR